ncbi:MAG TPA: TonB-dependent receptor [Methylotenera sp.]|nr:TonB-dependent receptor [Methylotenera sp.]HPV44862.1 TonB-dependent receptor [Methylotenera sp.]
MKKSTIASLIGLAFTSPVFAAENIQLEDVTVKANRFEHKDTETTYASEIHTAKQIEASGAATLYDYLAQQTSLNLLPNFGNKATPSINLRGYGGENGHQNVVITVDGQRLNNIDLSSQLLAGIPLGNIERIEISKGSGSVIYGDGATAGAIQIYTKAKTGATIVSSLGNFGQKNHYASAGFSNELIDISANLAHDSHDGFSKKDETGYKDQFTSNSQNVKIKIKPTEYLRLFAQATSSRNDTRYVNALIEAEFKDNPRQVTQRPFSQTYTHQALDTNQWQVGAEYDIAEQWRVSATHFREDKTSEFVNFFSAFKYDYEANELNVRYIGDQLSAIAGIQVYKGDRKNSSNITSKDNKAYFASAEYHPTWLLEGLTLSAGARGEKVRYKFNPDAGQSLNDSEHLSAWDIGANYQINPETSVFANYNRAFQAPDIDRFFAQDFSLFPVVTTTFNGFIKPMRSKTFNLGLNHTLPNNRFKVSAFYANLDNEIYLVPIIFQNTNIDKSHKYGLEIQDHISFTDRLSAGLIYTYTRAIVDKEVVPVFLIEVKNKDLPGVPKHAVTANLNYKFLDAGNINLSHAWRESTYAFNDFTNNATQKQGHYESTNIAVSYRYKKVQLFAAVNNIFEHENSIQVADDAIYPVDFARTWRVGFKADF